MALLNTTTTTSSSSSGIRSLTISNGHRNNTRRSSRNIKVPSSKQRHKKRRDDDEKSDSEQKSNSIAMATTSTKCPHNIRKIKKFVRCSKQIHLNLRTTSCADCGKLEIKICKGALPSDQLLYIKQHCQYQVRYNDHDQRQQTLLASIPKHFECRFSFKSIVSFTHYIINNKFIRFRNRGPTQTKAVSLWRIYEFEGEQTLFNIWIVMKAAERCIGSAGCLGEDVLKRIFGYLDGSKYHCWIHIHEVIDNAHHRSNLIGLEFDSNSRNIYVMQRSPALLKKVRQIGDKYFTKKEDGVNSVLSDSFFKKSVEMFHAVY